MSSYKPRFLQAFLMQGPHETIPELVEIDSSMHSHNTTLNHYSPPTPSPTKNSLSAIPHPHPNPNRSPNPIINTDQPNNKTLLRLTGELEELQRHLQVEKAKSREFEERSEELEAISNKLNTQNKQMESRMRELEKVNRELRESKEKLNVELREMRAQEVELVTTRSQTLGFDRDVRRETFERVEESLKRIVQEFLQSLRMEKLSRAVEDKVEQHLSRLMQINSFTVSKIPKLNQSLQPSSPHKFQRITTIDSRKMCISPERHQRSPLKHPQQHTDRLSPSEAMTHREGPIHSIPNLGSFINFRYASKESLQRSPRVSRSKSQRRRKIFG